MRDETIMVERRDMTYSELLGYPSLTKDALQTLCGRLALHLRREDGGAYDTCYERAVRAVAPARQGNCRELLTLLRNSDGFSQKQIDYIAAWPKSEVLERLSQALRAQSTLFQKYMPNDERNQ